jgi:hypothetical protein
MPVYAGRSVARQQRRHRSPGRDRVRCVTASWRPSMRRASGLHPVQRHGDLPLVLGAWLQESRRRHRSTGAAGGDSGDAALTPNLRRLVLGSAEGRVRHVDEQLAEIPGFDAEQPAGQARADFVRRERARLESVSTRCATPAYCAVKAWACGLMSANMLPPFHVGKALTSQDGPSSLIRESRLACAHESCPACHFTNASASAVM